MPVDSEQMLVNSEQQPAYFGKRKPASISAAFIAATTCVTRLDGAV
jgi:hypothetical protein